MRRRLQALMLSQVLSARFHTRNRLPQYCSISGINGRFSSLPCASNVARISCSLRTSTYSPAFKFRTCLLLFDIFSSFSPGCSQHQLAAVKSFGVSARRIRLHAAKPHQRHKGLFPEPAAAVLRLKRFQNRAHLLAAHGIGQRYEEVRSAHVAVIFRDLVFENHVVAKGAPGDLGEQPVILVSVLPVVSEDQVRIGLPFELFEQVLHLVAHERQEAVGKGAENLFAERAGGRKQLGTADRFGAPLILSTENHPMNSRTGMPLSQREQRTSAADFDVVGMGPQAQNLERRPAAPIQAEMDHACPTGTSAQDGSASRAAPAAPFTASFLQTCHGGLPLDSSSSSRCLSLNVSMHIQKPWYLYPMSACCAISLSNGCRTNSSPGRM